MASSHGIRGGRGLRAAVVARKMSFEEDSGLEIYLTTPSRFENHASTSKYSSRHAESKSEFELIKPQKISDLSSSVPQGKIPKMQHTSKKCQGNIPRNTYG